MGDKPESGARMDCERLLKNFSITGSLLYKDFVKEWQNMKFALIFRGRPSIHELIEFTEELFLIAKSYLFPPHSMSERIGAIYLLYGLYYRQPTQSKNDCFIRIRMEYNEWLEVLSFINKLKDYGYLDACYIFYKMVVDKVFHFVCFSRQFGIEKSRRKKRHENEICLPKKSKEDSSVLLEDLLQSCNFVSNWSKKEKEYNKLKKDLIERKVVDDAVKVDEFSFVDELKKNTEEVDQGHEFDVVNIGERRRALRNRKRTEGNKLTDSAMKPMSLAGYRNQLLDTADKEKEAEEIGGSSGHNSNFRSLNRRIHYVNDDNSSVVYGNSFDIFRNYKEKGSGKSSNESKDVTSNVTEIKDMPSLFEGPCIGSNFFCDIVDCDEESDSFSDSDSDDNFDMLDQNNQQNSKMMKEDL